MIDDVAPTCLLFKRLTHERKSKYLFSKPIAFSMGQRLYQSIDSIPISKEYFNPKGEIISVSDVINSRPKEHILVLPNFSYGQELDGQLLQIQEHQKVRTYVGNPHMSQSAMFFKQRATFALMISYEVNVYFEERAAIDYLSYPIANVTTPISVHVMCNNTKKSKLWLEKVNKGVEDIYHIPSYRSIYSTVYNAEEVQAILNLIDSD